ncbi:hypothetical protein LRP88_04032 [Fusarium phalaenopsidis]
MMSDVLEICNGKCVTALGGLKPPHNWTNDYRDMGYDRIWGPDGEVAELAMRHGIQGFVRPLFSEPGYRRPRMPVFQILGGKFYLYKEPHKALFEITSHTDLESIIATIDDENKGLRDLETKPV